MPIANNTGPFASFSGLEAQGEYFDMSVLHLQLGLDIEWSSGVLVHCDIAALLGGAKEDNLDSQIITVMC